MGIGGFLASQAERDHYRYLRRSTRARVKRSCDGEVEREVHAVLGPVGVDQSVSQRVALGLREVESNVDRSSGQASAPTDAEKSSLSEPVGVTEFLLKFGEGLGARLHPSFLWLWITPIGADVLFALDYRGGPNAPPLSVCVYDRDGLPRRGRDPINPLLLHPDRAHRAHLLVRHYWHRTTHLRWRQGEDYWCSKQRWIRVGGSKYIGGGRCCGRGSIWYSCALREKGVNCPVLCEWLLAACCISRCRDVIQKHLGWDALYNVLSSSN